MIAIATNEKTDIRAKLEGAIEKTKEACERLTAALERSWSRVQEKAAQSAKATDECIREHPYQAIGIAFGLGLLVGALAMRSRRK